jgi:transcriptional regulator
VLAGEEKSGRETGCKGEPERRGWFYGGVAGLCPKDGTSAEVRMYIPRIHAENDVRRLHALVRQYSFATLVSCFAEAVGSVVPFASHLPLLLDSTRGEHGVLRGHMARANPQWRHFKPDQEILAIFQGPHGYVSSNWYEEPAVMVPTWNYTAVHVYGKPRLIEATDQVFVLLTDMMAYYQPEGNPLSLQPPTERAQELVRAIVAFEMDITRFEGKFKLSQNRSERDRGRVRAALQQRGGADDLALADLMQDAEARF